MYTCRIGFIRRVVLNVKWFGRKRNGLTGEDSGELDLGKITTDAKGATIWKGKKHQKSTTHN
jgi:hypothetical protein